MVHMDITVYSVLWGDKYHPGYVYALKEMVEKNLTIPHVFKCITKQKLPGIQTVNPVVPYRGWWQKIGLFHPMISKGPSLYFDLDTVIVGNIDYLADYTNSRFAAPANWAQSGHGGIQSSVMAWDGTWHDPFNWFKYSEDSSRLWGDQEYLWEILGDNWVKIPHVGSYKYHCRASLPEWMKVICFHGKPDPHEVGDQWILPFTSTLRSHISGSMGNGSGQDLSATA